MNFRTFKPNEYRMLPDGTYQFTIRDLTVNEVNGNVNMVYDVINLETLKKGVIYRTIFLLDSDQKENSMSYTQLQLITKACYGGKAPDTIDLLDLKGKHFIAELSTYAASSGNKYYNYKKYEPCVDVITQEQEATTRQNRAW